MGDLRYSLAENGVLVSLPEIYHCTQLNAHKATETQVLSLNTVAKDLGVCNPWGFGHAWLFAPVVSASSLGESKSRVGVT